MRLLHVISEHIDVSPHHIHRFMSENPLQRKYVRSILYAHLGESVAKCMRTTSHILNISHAPILGDSPTNAISIHLLVVMRNKKPFDRRFSPRLQVSFEQTFSLRLNRNEPILAILARDKYLIIFRSNVVKAYVA